jgi:hypothetical protein
MDLAWMVQLALQGFARFSRKQLPVGFVADKLPYFFRLGNTPMKRMYALLSALMLLSLAACTLPAPGSQPPAATATLAPIDAGGGAAAQPSPTPLPTQAPAATNPPPPPPTVPPAPTQAAYPPPSTQAPPAPTSAPTAAPTLTPTPLVAFDPYLSLGEPKYENDMEIANRAEWAPPETRALPDNRYIRLAFRGGELTVTGYRPQFSTWWFSYHSLDDAFIEMTFETQACSGEDAYGIIFRGPPHQAGESYGYAVAFTCEGQVWLVRIDGVDPWDAETLVDEEDVKAVNTGRNEENVIGVRAEGDKITIYANGVQVAQVEDDVYEAGRVGVFVRAGSGGEYTYRVTNFAYWLLGVTP